MPKEPSAKVSKRATTSDDKKKRGKKDPNAPKRALSAYMFFSQANRETVIKENPEAKFGKLQVYFKEKKKLIFLYKGEIGKILGAKWKEMTDEEKKVNEWTCFSLRVFTLFIAFY
jgi:hypothetical protein